MTLAAALSIIGVLIICGVVWKLAETWLGEYIPQKIRFTIYLIAALAIFLWLLNVIFGFTLPGLKS